MEGVHHLSNESWPRLEGVASPSSALSWWKEALNLFWCLLFWLVSRTAVVSLVGPRASDSNSLNKEEEEKITMQVEGVQKEQEKEQQKEKKKSKLVGWSTENMEEKQSNQEFKHSGEMVQWRSIDQEEIDKMWKTMSK